MMVSRWMIAAALCLAATGCGTRAELGAPCPPALSFAGGHAADCGPERAINFGRL